MRPPRRNERHPSLVRVETVNGADAEPPEQRPWFGELTVRFPTRAPRRAERRALRQGLARGGRRAARLGRHDPAARGREGARRGRVACRSRSRARAPRSSPSGASSGSPVVGGSFERSPEAQAQAAELAVERGKRQAERGGHAVVVVDSPAGAAARHAPAHLRRGPRQRGGRHADDPRRRRRGHGDPALGDQPRRARLWPRRAAPSAATCSLDDQRLRHRRRGSTRQNLQVTGWPTLAVILPGLKNASSHLDGAAVEGAERPPYRRYPTARQLGSGESSISSKLRSGCA